MGGERTGMREHVLFCVAGLITLSIISCARDVERLNRMIEAPIQADRDIEQKKGQRMRQEG